MGWASISTLVDQQRPKVTFKQHLEFQGETSLQIDILALKKL